MTAPIVEPCTTQSVAQVAERPAKEIQWVTCRACGGEIGVPPDLQGNQIDCPGCAMTAQLGQGVLSRPAAPVALDVAPSSEERVRGEVAPPTVDEKKASRGTSPVDTLLKQQPGQQVCSDNALPKLNKSTRGAWLFVVALVAIIWLIFFFTGGTQAPVEDALHYLSQGEILGGPRQPQAPLRNFSGLAAAMNPPPLDPYGVPQQFDSDPPSLSNGGLYAPQQAQPTLDLGGLAAAIVGQHGGANQTSTYNPQSSLVDTIQPPQYNGTPIAARTAASAGADQASPVVTPLMDAFGLPRLASQSFPATREGESNPMDRCAHAEIPEQFNYTPHGALGDLLQPSQGTFARNIGEARDRVGTGLWRGVATLGDIMGTPASFLRGAGAAIGTRLRGDDGSAYARRAFEGIFNIDRRVGGQEVNENAGIDGGIVGGGVTDIATGGHGLPPLLPFLAVVAVPFIIYQVIQDRQLNKKQDLSQAKGTRREPPAHHRATNQK